MTKVTVVITKWQPTEWKWFFTNYILSREVISKSYEELKKLDTNNKNKSLNLKYFNISNQRILRSGNPCGAEKKYIVQ